MVWFCEPSHCIAHTGLELYGSPSDQVWAYKYAPPYLAYLLFCLISVRSLAVRSKLLECNPHVAYQFLLES